MSTATQLVTTEDLLAMPDDGVERWIINGELFEGDRNMTRRNRPHSRVMMAIGALIRNWSDQCAAPTGEVVGGEAGFRLSANPDTTVGIDVAYISPEVAAANPDDAKLIDGAPVLAVEILSPSDTSEAIDGKVATYLEHGVESVWVVNPTFETVTVYSPDAEPVLHNTSHTIPAIAGMPGFEPNVARIFA